ncbi:MAG: ribose-5-phosphate isomerase RpiA [Anaerolineae bacterium]|nr:ribose-5-phosphate isomerase RpiA [Gloeobacterales cyanobacterium ES-bin-313]
MTSMDRLKQMAAIEAVKLIEADMVVGLGTGSTAAFAVEALGERVAKGLRIVGIPTSERTAAQAEALGIPLGSFAIHARIDLTIDGADEVEVGSLNLIKGLGGALLREKIVASASQKLVIIVDESKLVEHLGTKTAVPVEVVPFGWQATKLRLEDLGATVNLRVSQETTFITDGGHYILDCKFGSMADPKLLESQIAQTVGVVESGLFIGMTSQVIVAGASGIRVLVKKVYYPDNGISKAKE